jgi:hypothetical protein
LWLVVVAVAGIAVVVEAALEDSELAQVYQ